MDRLTLAAVATRLGVRLPSLYKHVAGLDALHAHVAADLSAATVGRAGRDALLHGFVAIETAGGFKMPQDLDRSYRRLV